MADQTIYAVDGTVQAGEGTYIKRKADGQLLEHCRAGHLSFILTSRQVGKSSLMVHTAQQLERENIRSVIIDLNMIGVKVSVDQWYLGILNEISNTLDLKTDILGWWSEHSRVAPAQRMTNFFHNVLLKEVSQPIVLFFDEIDSTLSLSFSRDDFFIALHALYDARSTMPELKRLSIVLLGAAAPIDLATDEKHTPFNIGYRVELTDFTPEEAIPLANDLSKDILDWVFHWTGGHPYLTQRLCVHLLKTKKVLTKKDIADAAKSLFEGEQGQQDLNLQFVHDMLTNRSPHLRRTLINIYEEIRLGEKVSDDEYSIPKAHLKVSGIVRSENGQLLLRNRIYESVFDLAWIKENTDPVNTSISVATSSTNIYTVGGTVQASGGIYIKRKADDELLALCRASELTFILSSRQVGKSSLMVRTAEQLNNENICSVIIDLSSIGVNVSADEWYLGILNEIENSLKLKTDIFTWWSKHAGLSPATNMTNFFRDVLLKEVNEPVVLFFDEIDSTLSIPFAGDFFAALRAVYNARSTTPAFKRLSFVMIGVATPGQLIADSKRTPFNIGHRVDLIDFTYKEALPLAGKLDKQVLRWVLAWTGGHPYLTQRLCSYLSKTKKILTENDVAATVHELFEGEQGRQDNNLQFVRDMLTKRSPNLSQVLNTYKDIRAGKSVTDDERSIVKAHLKISGVVRSENGRLLPRNQIYKKVFSTSWAQENSPKNWQKVALISLSFAFVLLLLGMLAIFINDYQVGKQIAGHVRNFISARYPPQRLSSLAAIYQEKGFLSYTDSNIIASQLFYGLPSVDDQLALFNSYEISQSASTQNDLIVVISNLYSTVADVSLEEDNTDLLQTMYDSLGNVSDNKMALDLQNEIGSWLEGRKKFEEKKYEGALESYNKALSFNPVNHALLYERAKVFIALEQYRNALLDLDNTLEYAKKSVPDFEVTPIPAFITSPIFVNSTSVSVQLPTIEFSPPPSDVTVTPLQVGVIPTKIISDDVADIPTLLPEYPPVKKHESRFTTLIDVVNAIRVLIKETPQLRIVAQSNGQNGYSNLELYGLIQAVSGVQPVICTPESSTVNIYRVPPTSWAEAIFDMAFPPVPTSIPPSSPIPTQFNDQQILGARYAAFQYLLDETKRWSDTETITLSDQSKTRITLTFISPELLQAVFLSDVLKDRFITSDFQTQLQNMLNNVAERDELLFLLTITTSNNNITPTRHTIKIPLNSMTLNNAENLIVLHSHDDHNLGQLIDTSAEPVFGYIAYPFAMLSGGQCKWVLDPKYNTNIVISVPFIEVDGVNSGSPFSWSIPYSSLLNPIAPSNIPIPFLPAGFDPNLMTPLELPPSEIDQNDYLQNFARFIWNQVTLENY